MAPGHRRPRATRFPPALSPPRPPDPPSKVDPPPASASSSAAPPRPGSRPPGLPSLQQKVRSRLGDWRRIGAPPHVLRWIQEGVRCDWIQAPPLPFHHGVSSLSPADRMWVTAEADRGLLTGAFRRATSFDFVSRAFIVEHNGKRRLVLNFSYINKFETKRSCRFESLASLRRMAKRGDLMYSIDLKDAYHHLGIFKGDQKYFTFGLETTRGIEYFHCSALSFGWTKSPWYFVHFVKPVIAYLRNPSAATKHFALFRRLSPQASSGQRVLPWLDDFAFFIQGCMASARALRDFTFETFDGLGLTRNTTKGQPEPSHVLHDHLGFCIDTVRGLFLLTQRREAKLRAGAAALICRAARHRGLVRAHDLGSFCGLAQASYLALPLARCWLRAPYDDLELRRGWSGETRLSRQSLSDIKEFTQLRNSKHVGRSIWLRPDTATGHVDAGPLGWGGQINESRAELPAYGFWSAEEAAVHITWRELRAVRLYVLWYLETLRGRRLLLFEDNQAVVAILTNLTSKSPALMRELRLLVEVLDWNDISIRALYIRSAENKIADYFSRIARARDYRIVSSVFELAQGWWGTCTVDAFASTASALLPRFWSDVPTPAAEATDAFAQTWTGERVWAHPPPSLLPQLVQLLRTVSGAEALVCTPHWPGEAWFAELQDLASEVAHFPAGSLQRIAFDAPARLESWPVTIFRLVPR